MGSRPGKQPSQAGVPHKPAITLGSRPGRQPSQAGQAGQARQAILGFYGLAKGLRVARKAVRLLATAMSRLS